MGLPAGHPGRARGGRLRAARPAPAGDMVPPTVLRDGPLGPGSVQWWIEEDECRRAAWSTSWRRTPSRPGWLRGASTPRPTTVEHVVLAHADDPELAAMALFDVVANNADRKGGHVLARAGDGPAARGRPRPDLQRRAQAAHRAVGLGRVGSMPGRPARRCSSALADLLEQTRSDARPRADRRTAGRPARRCRGAGHPGAGSQRLLVTGRFPRPGAGAATRPSRGRRSEAPAVAAVEAAAGPRRG